MDACCRRHVLIFSSGIRLLVVTSWPLEEITILKQMFKEQIYKRV